MQIRNFVFLAVGLVVGGAAILCLRCEKATAGLVGGKYLVVQSASGHWIYEATADGLKPVVQEVSLEGLHAIWELQSAYQPKSIRSGDQEIVHLPTTRADTRSFQVFHKFYAMKEGKLVEIPQVDLVAAK
jgi:hypothetical protein